MGCCYCVEGTKVPAESPEDCGTGCTYGDGDCGPSCAFSDAFAMYVVRRYGDDPIVTRGVRGTLSALYDLRHTVIEQSPIGQQLMQAYREFAGPALQIVESDPQLHLDALSMFLRAADFGNFVFRVYVGRREPGIAQQRFTRETYEEGLQLLARFREQAPAQEFEGVLQYLESMLAQFVGLTASEVLEVLLRGSTTATSKSR